MESKNNLIESFSEKEVTLDQKERFNYLSKDNASSYLKPDNQNGQSKLKDEVLKKLNAQVADAYSKRNKDIYPDSIYRNIAPKTGLLSIYQKRPEDLYKRHILQAKNGNEYSQYQVFRSLYQCSDVPNTIKANKSIKRYIAKGDIDNLLFAWLKRDAFYCKDIFAIVNSNEISAIANGWLKKLQENKYPLALAHDIYKNPEYVLTTQAVETFQRALKLDRLSTLYYIQHYSFRLYQHNNELSYDNGYKWLYIYCHYQENCDVKKLINHSEILTKYRPAQLNVLIEKAKNIIIQLDNGTYELTADDL